MPPESKEPGPTPNAGTNPGRRGDSWFSRIIRAGIALADGKPTDWSAIERLPCRPRQRAQLRELQEIERIAQHYRGAQAEDGAQLIDLGEHFTSSLSDTLAAIQGRRLFSGFAPDELIGNRYLVKSLLGRGGMGTVYEAWDEELSISVVLKTLRLDPGRQRDGLRNLKQEAMLARAVVHPNVCRVYDLGSHGNARGGVWFLTMEVLRGVTLAERLQQRSRFAPEEAWPLVEQMAAGLEAAHQSGVVHLDFKSSNVMLVGEVGNEQAVVPANRNRPSSGAGWRRRAPTTKRRLPSNARWETGGTRASS